MVIPFFVIRNVHESKAFTKYNEKEALLVCFLSKSVLKIKEINVINKKIKHIYNVF